MKKTYDIVIVGAGLSGLSVAYYLSRQNPPPAVLLLEKDDRAGGAIRSLREDGYLAEWGPHGFLDNVDESRELIERLGFGTDVQRAPLRRFRRYICRTGTLKAIPQSPPQILKSDLLSLPAKLRMLGDLWRKPLPDELSVADWVTHRFGKSLLPFADVAMTGTFAGDIERLSLEAALPGLRRLELAHGSVFRGAMRHQKQRSGGRLPAMVSFKGGMEQLVEALARDRTIRFQSEVTSIVREADSWCLRTPTDEYRSSRVVLALHINPALSILDRLSPAPRRSVPVAVIYNVVFGFGEGADIPFGFGYLAPKVENRFALGALFPTHMFPDRAPKGIQTLEVLVGGIRNPERLTLDDETLVQATLADVRQLIRLPKKPIFTRLLKPVIGIPQLEIGHKALQDYRERIETAHPGLFICGFGWEGIGTNEMIKMAKQTAAAISAPAPRPKEPAAVKGVYF